MRSALAVNTHSKAKCLHPATWRQQQHADRAIRFIEFGIRIWFDPIEDRQALKVSGLLLANQRHHSSRIRQLPYYIESCRS